jgi:hypothetical protein
MNYSIVTADRNTHLKVVGLALAAVIAIVVVGFSARVDDSKSVVARGDGHGPIVKASKVILFTERPGSEVR